MSNISFCRNWQQEWRWRWRWICTSKVMVIAVSFLLNGLGSELSTNRSGNIMRLDLSEVVTISGSINGGWMSIWNWPATRAKLKVAKARWQHAASPPPHRTKKKSSFLIWYFSKFKKNQMKIRWRIWRRRRDFWILIPNLCSMNRKLGWMIKMGKEQMRFGPLTYVNLLPTFVNRS